MPHFIDAKLCTGCMACMNSCPEKCIGIRFDEYGFAYPFLSNPSSCISCGICEKSCPLQIKKEISTELPVAFAAYSKNHFLRMKSSSGGIFSEIANEVIAEGGGVCGAVFDKDFVVRHQIVTKQEKLESLRGAKYSESWLGDIFSQIKIILKTGSVVLFSGTPCQVAGLKSFLNKDYSNLICIDFVCHGVPSPLVWKRYVQYRASIDNGGELPIDINMREKTSGWTRYSYSSCFKYFGGNEFRETSTINLYMKLFTQNYILRESCENCAFKGYYRVSDITLGDFWGIWDLAPEMDDNQGTSVVLIHSKKGNDYWNAIKERICFKHVPIESTSDQNKSMIVSSKRHEKRDSTLDKICSEGFSQEVLNQESKSPAKGIVNILRKFFKSL